MAKITEDKGFRAGFTCLSARGFAKGIPLLRDHYDLDSMEVTEIPGGSIMLVSADDPGIKEIIPDKCFLFESDTASFILNLEFKSKKGYGDLYQVVDQHGSIYNSFLNRMIARKRETNSRKGYYGLLKKRDRFPDIYSFIINTSSTPWENNDWEDPNTYKKVLDRRPPERRYFGTVDVMELSERQLKRFNEDVECVFRFAQAKGDDNKVEQVVKNHRDKFSKMDMPTSLLALALIGKDHYIAALSSKYIDCKEESFGMLRLYFDKAKINYYADKIRYEKKNAKDEGLRQGKAQGVKQGIKQGIKQGKMEERLSIARSMLEDGDPIEKVARNTRLPERKVRGLAKSMGVFVA